MFQKQISLPVLSLENLASSAALFEVWTSFSWYGSKVSWPGSCSCKFVRLWLSGKPGEIQAHPNSNRINRVNPFQTGQELLRSHKRNKCFKNKCHYLFLHLKIFPLLLPGLRFDHHFLDMVLRPVGQDLVLANLSGSGSRVNLVKYKYT